MNRLLLAVPALLLFASCSDDDSSEGRTITVTHGVPADPVYVDLGDEGPSVGDTRMFRFDAETDGGQVVRTHWIMTTTGVDDPEEGVESRNTKAIFTFGELGDQLILEGVGEYPGANATLAPSSTVIRSIIGGSGEFAGASGDVESIRAADGTWTHIFHLDD